MNIPKTQPDKDKFFIEKLLDGWSIDKSPSYKLLTELYGFQNREFLQKLARILQSECNLYLDREVMRKLDVLYVWLDHNYSVIEPFLKSGSLCVTNEDYVPVGNQTINSISLLQEFMETKK